MSRNHSRWLSLCLGIAVILSACKPAEDERDLVITSVVTPTIEEDVAADEATDTPFSTKLPPPEPTSLPTAEPDAWQMIGNESTGLRLAVPPDWRNLSGSLDTAAAANRLGLVVLLSTSSDRIGSSLLAGKGSGAGAYSAGLITNLPLPDVAPAQALLTLLADYLPENTAVSDPTPVESLPDVNGETVAGAYVDLEGTAVIFPDSASNQMRTRLLLFPLTAENGATPMQAIFLFAADAAEWNTYAPVFDQMAQSLSIYNLFQGIVINDGRGNVSGSLDETARVNGRLQTGVHDIWTFNANSGQYATITVRPDDTNLDLILSIISPKGQTVMQIDNGFAADTEVVIDLLLQDSGTYVIDVGEFFNEGGRYALSFVLTDEPLFNDGGRVEFGQTIQSDLAASGQKIWMFSGTAGQLVSIVLIPDGPFDAILELYSPDGSQLLGLDEGFSGDAEVIAGYELPLTGEYTVLVRSFAGDGGTYSLSLDEGGEDTLNFYDAGDLTYGDVRQETLQPNEAQAWFFNGKAGDAVQIDVTPVTESLDLDVWLLDPDIERLSSQDVFLSGESEQIEQILPKDGQYLILVTDFFGEVGDYQITLSARPIVAPQVAGELSLGDTVEGMLAAGESEIWYFEGDVGDVIFIEVTPDEADRDVAFDIVGPDGNRIRQVDAQSGGGSERVGMFTLTVNGRWGVVISEFFGDTTAFTLTVDRDN